MKVTQRLVHAGFIVSQRGRGGGLMLARAPGAINVGDVVRAVEDTGQFVECNMGAGNACIVTPVCGLSHMLAGAVEAFLVHLDKFTLADVVKKKKGFQEIFAIAA
jgi:Rrf2 family nitric oxide-sensitive transcriptional repressor